MNRWSYSSYRAMLRLDGKPWALVSPNGRDALSANDAMLLENAMNSYATRTPAPEAVAGEIDEDLAQGAHPALVDEPKSTPPADKDAEINRIMEGYGAAVMAQREAVSRMEKAESSLLAANQRIEALEGALAFYANPDTYFAFMFLGDEPCGEFLHDFDEEHGGDYNRPMPGKTARKALAHAAEVGPKGDK